MMLLEKNWNSCTSEKSRPAALEILSFGSFGRDQDSLVREVRAFLLPITAAARMARPARSLHQNRQAGNVHH